MPRPMPWPPPVMRATGVFCSGAVMDGPAAGVRRRGSPEASECRYDAERTRDRVHRTFHSARDAHDFDSDVITDFHAHVFSRPFFDAIAAVSPQPGTPEEKLARVSAQVGFELPEPGAEAHLARWIASLDAGGVQRMAAFSSDPAETPTVLEMAARSGGRLVPIAVCNPAAPGAADRLRPLFEEKGLRGILLFPAVHHYHLDDEAVQPVLGLLEEHGAVAYVHCGVLVVKLKDLLGLPRPYDLRYANPLEVIPAANRHPRRHLLRAALRSGLLPRDPDRRRPVPQRRDGHLLHQRMGQDTARPSEPDHGPRARTRRVRPRAGPLRHRFERVSRRMAQGAI